MAQSERRQTITAQNTFMACPPCDYAIVGSTGGSTVTVQWKDAVEDTFEDVVDGTFTAAFDKVMNVAGKIVQVGVKTGNFTSNVVVKFKPVDDVY